MSDTSTSPVPRSSSRFMQKLGQLQLWLAALALICMMLVTVADVVMRYAFNNPVRGTYDFTEAMLVIFVFHGMAVCFLAGSNIVIDLIDSFANSQITAALKRFGDLVSLSMLLIFIYAAWTPATQAYSNGERKLQLDLPIWTLWAVAIVGLFVTIICSISIVFGRRRVRAPQGPGL